MVQTCFGIAWALIYRQTVFQLYARDRKFFLQLFSGEFNKNLEELVMFLAQVAKCYPVEMSDYPQRLVDLLNKHSTVIDPVNLKDVLLQLISRG